MAILLLLATLVTLCLCQSTTPRYRPQLPSLSSAGEPESKVWRIPVQREYLNASDGTEVAYRRRRLAERGWGWKHLEDYRGFLYFIESMQGRPLVGVWR